MTYKAEHIVPYTDSKDKKTVQVRRMFNEIATQYDFFNHAASMGMDRLWRRKGILSLKDINPGKLLDIATGTGDLALEAYHLLHPDRITGIDISEKMMEVANEKVSKANLSEKINFQQQDCSKLSFENDTFDAATVAFGVRNFENLDISLQEILRVLRPGGKLMILELTFPEYFQVKKAYILYSKVFIPLIGRLISGNKNAYNYLPESIAAFPQNKIMTAILQKNGFTDVKFRKLTWGICALYTGRKK